jgi:subtilisin family serine protease
MLMALKIFRQQFRIKQIFLLAILFFLYSFSSALAQTKPDISKTAWVSGSLLVKFRDSLTASASSVMRRGDRFSDYLDDHSKSLDEINKKFKVKEIRSLVRTKNQEMQLEIANGRKPISRELLRRQWVQRSQDLFNRKRKKVANIQSAEIADLSHAYEYDFDPNVPISEILSALKSNQHVEYAQPNYKVSAVLVPNDYYYSRTQDIPASSPLSSLWWLKQDNIEEAWDITKGAGVTVAVVDTGVDSSHPELEGQVLVNSSDPHGHGTFIAGMIAAKQNNQIGISGIAPESKILPITVLDQYGHGDIYTISNGIIAAVDQGADIINISIACDMACPYNPLMEDAVRYAIDHNVLPVIAAGNSTANVDNISPQNMISPKPLVVSAGDQYDHPTFFTNYGATIDLIAPGGGAANYSARTNYDIYNRVWNVLSLYPMQGATGGSCGYTDPSACRINDLNGYKYVRSAGTSFAAPQVAGAAALVLSRHPDYTPEQLRFVLSASARDTITADETNVFDQGAGIDYASGHGALNVRAALNETSLPTVTIHEPAENTRFVQNSKTPVSVNMRVTANGGELTKYSIFVEGDESHYLIASGSAPLSNSLLSNVTLPLRLGRTVIKLVAEDVQGRRYTTSRRIFVESSSSVITSWPAPRTQPLLAGNYVIWKQGRLNDSRLEDIFFQQLPSGPATQLTNYLVGSSGAIGEFHSDGVMIVWQEAPAWGSNDSIIRYYSLSTGVSGNVTGWARASGDYGYGSPRVSGSRVVYRVSHPSYRGIFFRDINVPSEPARNILPYFSNPDIKDNRVVAETEGGDGVAVFDLTENTSLPMQNLLPDMIRRLNSKISGNYVVYLCMTRTSLYSDMPQYDICLYDFVEQREIYLSQTSSLSEALPMIVGDVVSWMEASDLKLISLSNTKKRAWYSGVIPYLVTAQSGAPVFVRDGYLRRALVEEGAASATLQITKLDTGETGYSHLVVPGTCSEFVFEAIGVSSSLSFRVINMPNGATFNSSTNRLKWCPSSSDQKGWYRANIYAQGSEVQGSAILALLLQESFPLTMNFTSLPPRFVYEGEAVQFSIDINNAGLPIRYNNSLPLGATFDAKTTTFYWAPPEGTVQNGSSQQYSLSFVANNGAHEVTLTHVLEVKKDGPRYYPLPRQFAREGEQLAVSLTPYGPWGVEPYLNVEVTGDLPQGANFNSETHVFTWTPPDNFVQTGQTANITVPIYTTSNGVRSSTEIPITVQKTDVLPVFNPVQAVIARAGALTRVEFVATDADGSITDIYPSTSSFVLPLGAVFRQTSAEPGRSTAVIEWRPTTAQVSATPYRVRLSAQDHERLYPARSLLVSITVANNTPVTLAPIANQQVVAGNTLSLALSGVSDPGEVLSYSGANLPSGMLINSATGVVTWRPSVFQIGSHQTIFSVSDGVHSATQQATIVVNAPLTADLAVANSWANAPAVLGVNNTYTVLAGKAFAINYTVKNYGGANAGSNNTRISGMPSTIGMMTYALAPGAEKIYTSPQIQLNPGNYSIQIVVDSSNRVIEADENNNFTSINVIAIAQPIMTPSPVPTR